MVSTLVFLGLSEVNLLVDKSKYLMFTMVFSIIFGIYFLYEKKLNILSELMNSSISPLLLIFISSLMLGVNEWMYILLFKAAESLSQLITFVLAGIRNKKNLILMHKGDTQTSCYNKNEDKSCIFLYFLFKIF